VPFRLSAGNRNSTSEIAPLSSPINFFDQCL